MRRNRFLNGFTLIELLIVVAIIGLLVSILLPTFHKVRHKSYQVCCISNLRQIGQALEMYVYDNDMYLPVCAWRPGDNPDNLPYLHQVLSSYLCEVQGVFHCPADRFYYYEEGTSYEWNQLINGYRYDTQPDFEKAPYFTRSDVPILYDIDNFHFGRKNILYPDCRVGGID